MLTNDQLLTIQADILANPDLNALPNAPDGAFEIAKLYNLNAVPDFYIWKSNYSTKDIREVMVWDEYLTTSADDKSTFELMISNGVINMAKVNVRAGIDEIFKNPGQAGALAAVTDGGKRLSTRLEKLLSTGTGTQIAPAIAAFEGNVFYQDIHKARNL